MSDESASDEQLEGSDDREVGEEFEHADAREIDEEREASADRSDGEDEHEPTLSGIFGARGDDAPPRPDVQPESISAESALFVLLGIVLALFVLYRTAAVLVA